jgi:hypothetical protein
MTTKYRVRAGFFPEIKQGNSRLCFSGGDEIELTPEQYNDVKHMIEEVSKVKESKNATV